MKKTIILFMLALGVGIASAQQLTASIVSNLNSASFKWKEITHDFGQIEKGIPVTHEFKFTNDGTSALVISDVKPSCGCTTPDWTREPINPGESGSIKATYNAASTGAFNKTITVSSNTGSPVVLRIKGEVK